VRTEDLLVNWFNKKWSKNIGKYNCHFRRIKNPTKGCLNIIGMKQYISSRVRDMEAPNVDNKPHECGHVLHWGALVCMLHQRFWYVSVSRPRGVRTVRPVCTIDADTGCSFWLSPRKKFQHEPHNKMSQETRKIKLQRCVLLFGKFLFNEVIVFLDYQVVVISLAG
jgi:hypothetical protein